MIVPFAHTLLILKVDTPLRRLTVLLISITLISAWLLWFTMAQITLYEVSDTANTQVSDAVHLLDAPVAGKIINVNVTLGQKVQQGDILFEIDAEREQLQIKEMQAKLAGLADEIDSLEAEFIAVEKASDYVSVAASAGLDEAKAEYEKAQTKALFTQQRLARVEAMYEKHQVSEIEILSLRSEAKEHEANAKALKQALKRIEQGGGTDVSDRQARLQRLRTELLQRQNEKNILSSGIERLQYEVNLRQVTSPVTGRAGNVPSVQSGTVVEEGETLVRIVPNSQLMVVAYFKPAAAVGRILPGQKGRLILSGFPWIQYGTMEVTVQNIGNEVRNGIVEVELSVRQPEDSVIPIQHGMPATVEIEVDHVTPAELVLRAAGHLLQQQPTVTTSGS